MEFQISTTLWVNGNLKINSAVFGTAAVVQSETKGGLRTVVGEEKGPCTEEERLEPVRSLEQKVRESRLHQNMQTLLKNADT